MKRYRIYTLFLPAIFLFSACSAASPAALQTPAAGDPGYPGSGGSSDVHSDVPQELSPQAPDSDLAELVQGNSEFAFAMYREITAGDENLFYSPYSMSIALAMTYAGAKGQTADQMAQALHYTLPQEALHPAFNKLALELASRSEIEDLEPDQVFRLHVANSLWGQVDYHFEQDFLDLLARNYGAGMRLLDFIKDPEGSRLVINEWVSRETEEKVKDIIPPGVITDLTRLVLANAVYFNAAWAHPFPEDSTGPDSFRLTDGKTVEVPMMRQRAEMRVMSGDGYRMAELPYIGGQLSMLVLLPDEGGLGGLEDRLDADLLSAAVGSLRGAEVDLAMPKFDFEWEAQKLPEAFKRLGMTDAFTGAADFSGMTGKPELHIGAILHKSFVGVDEAGTEAAAATVVIMMRESAPIGAPVEFTVDRPFLFLIRDNLTGTILFLGRVVNPVA
jgi:serpin B